jgi:hypothetical protein
LNSRALAAIASVADSSIASMRFESFFIIVKMKAGKEKKENTKLEHGQENVRNILIFWPLIRIMENLRQVREICGTLHGKSN